MLVLNENNKKVSEDDDREKSKTFKDELLKFNTLHGRENFKVPQIGGKELDLYKLFKEVIGRGGSQQVSENKHWKEIVNALDLPASCTSASFTLRNHYSKCLHSYENYYMKAQQNPGMNFRDFRDCRDHSLPGNSISAGNPMNNPMSNPMSSLNPPQITTTQPTPLQEQKFLNKKVARSDTEFNLVFRYNAKQAPSSRDKILQKKVRLLNAVPDLRRVVLAFESHVTSEIIWSLNMLMLFSANVNCTLQVENQPYLLESMTNYMSYCINNISDLYNIMDMGIDPIVNKLKSHSHVGGSKRAKSFHEATTFNFLDEITNSTINLSTISKKNKDLESDAKFSHEENSITQNYLLVTEFELLEHLISIVQIIRNLSYQRLNEPFILKCAKLMNCVYILFVCSSIQEIRVNLLDFLTNLSKHIVLKDLPQKLPLQLLQTLFECLKCSNRETAEQALECFRRLTFSSGNEEYFERMPDEFYQELINQLICFKIEVRESALEILYCISDQKLPTKTRLGKQSKCIQRLVALTCSNSIDNRIPKFAACTLAKLAEVPAIMKLVMPYEQELFVAACTDDSITKIIIGFIS